MRNPNPQKLMATRTGQTIPKPRVRRRKGRGGGSFPWQAEGRTRLERTTWFGSIADLMRRR